MTGRPWPTIVRYSAFPVATRSDDHIVALDKLEAFEHRIKDLVKATQDLRQRNQSLEQDVRAMRARLMAQDEATRRWERERAQIRARVEKVLGEVELLECWEDSKEVSLG